MAVVRLTAFFMDNCNYIVLYYSKTGRVYTYRFYHLQNARNFAKDCKENKNCDLVEITKIIK